MYASRSWRQYSHSSPAKRYVALGKVGVHRPLTRRVFQPTWSMWRCVQITRSTRSGVTPAAARSSSHAPCRWCQAATSSRGLSLPTHVSMRTRCSGVRTTNVWMREPMSPVRSSKKCGLSHDRCRATPSAVESGSIDGVGNDERSISTTELIVTSPSVIAVTRPPRSQRDRAREAYHTGSVRGNVAGVTRAPGALGEVFRLFLKLGVIGFGGPAAHIVGARPLGH